MNDNRKLRIVPEAPRKARPVYWPQTKDGTYYAYIGGSRIEIVPADDDIPSRRLWSLWIDGEMIGDDYRSPADAQDAAMERIDTWPLRAIRWSVPVAAFVVGVGLGWGLL